MNMESMDFGEESSGGMKLPDIKWKPIGIIVLGLVAIGLLGYLALNIVNAVPISMSFEDSKINGGESTTLEVVTVNTGEVDAKDVKIEIIPESDIVTVADPIRTELVMGSKARRNFEFTVSVLESATPGTYKLTAKVSNLGEEDQFASTYLEVI